MQIVTHQLDKNEAVAILKTATLINADETGTEVFLDTNGGAVSIEQVLADLEYHMIRHPEIPFPVRRISVTFPEELQGKKTAREFFYSIHDVVCDELPFGCMLASVQTANRTITIYVDGKPVVYHVYIEIYIIPPEDMASGFGDLDLERLIRQTAYERYGILERREPELPEPEYDDYEDWEI